ncbi:MAG: hypothetical protein M5R37_00560 [Melioribacteraceae bacterium]|nr:hypothetical protein [Melioribacteraceae bacterium]
MRTLKSIITLIILCLPLFAQGINLGFRLEPIYVFAEDDGTSDDFFSPYSLKMSFIVEPINSIGLEIRPGFLIAGEEFMGWEVGTFANYKIPKSSFSILVGINHFYKTQTGGNNRGSEGGYFPFYGLGIGFNQNENIRIDLSYFITSRKEYASYRYYDYSSLKVLHYKKTLTGVLRIGLNIAFNIIQF